jgi:hypothetical protein
MPPLSEDEQIVFDQLDLNFSKWLSQPLDGMVVLAKLHICRWKNELRCGSTVKHIARRRETFYCRRGGETTLTLTNILPTPLRQILDAFQSNWLEEAPRL